MKYEINKQIIKCPDRQKNVLSAQEHVKTPSTMAWPNYLPYISGIQRNPQ